TYYVFVDTDKDGTSDYRLQTVREKGLDYPLVKVSKRSNGKWQAIENALYPLNGTWGDTDTNIMDSNTLVMTVPLSVLGLDPNAESTEISYSVTTSSAFSATTVVDTTDSVVFNYAAPKLWFSGESAGVPNLFVDAPSAQLVAHRNGDAKNVSALFLHMHNATGDLSGVNGAAGERAQVLRVSSNSEATAASAHFKDVPVDYPFVNDINWLAQRRITTGYPDGTFRPNGSVERGAMAAFFYRFAGSPAYSAPVASPFSDVSAGSQFYREISWLAEQRITTGWADGSFRPVQPIERGAMAAFLHRYNVR
ncbi:MAG: S-layer homology domain-containing protein, partial [Rothia mucilaginosa]|nr:S-layer homology domain-containing protein [Rothia mucilaginosa]